jgi:hypothetical protein
MSWRGGFLLKAEEAYDALVTTGKATWEVARLQGYEFTPGISFVRTTNGAGLRTAVESGRIRQSRCRTRSNQRQSLGESASGRKLFPTHAIATPD